MKENVYKNHKLAVYKSKEDILNQFGITEEEFENILLELNYEKKLAYTYYYGIDRPKMDLFDISELLHVSENVVKIYINLADDFIKSKVKKIHPIKVKKYPTKVKNDSIKIKNDSKKEKNDTAKSEQNLDLKELEKELLDSFSDYFEKKDNSKNVIKASRGRSFKTSFFDYFKVDKTVVLKLIEEYKELDYDSYEALKKLYGENYDQLVIPCPLTKEEKYKFKVLKKDIMDTISTGNDIIQEKKMKKSFFGKFDKIDEDDKKLILEIIETYKKKNHDYYKVLVKAYVEEYDGLNTSLELTDREKIQLKNFIAYIKNKLNSKNQIKTPRGRKLKPSFFDYFKKEEDKKIALGLVEEYKELDHDSYEILTKLYGDNYDQLVIPCPLTKEEKDKFKAFKKDIMGKVSNGLKLKMCDLYKKFPTLKEEKELDLIVLTCYIDQGKSIESIFELTKISTKQIDNILLRHLYLFSYRMYVVIDDILKRGNYTISQIMSFNFIKMQEPFLNEIEKELLYDKIITLYNCELQNVLKVKDKSKLKTLK